MVGISRISTYGTLAGNLQNLRRQQESLTIRATQLNTGKKYSTLIEYRQNITNVLTFQQDIDRKTETVDRLAVAETVVRSYDSTLDAFDKKIDTLLKRIEDSRGFNSDVDTERFSRWQVENREYFDNFLREANELINTRVGNRYIYSGSAYNVRPVRDLSDEPVPTQPTPTVPFVPAATNLIPAYATLTPAGTADERLTDDQLVSLDSSSLTYGITFTDPAFQRLFQAFSHFKTALARPTEAERIAYLDEARDLLQTAKIDLQALRENEASNLQAVTQAQADTKSEKSLQENYLAQLTQIVPEEVSVEISAIRNQIEASFRSISVQDRLSIENFLF
jgi:hypothetical protein